MGTILILWWKFVWFCVCIFVGFVEFCGFVCSFVFFCFYFSGDLLSDLLWLRWLNFCWLYYIGRFDVDKYILNTYCWHEPHPKHFNIIVTNFYPTSRKNESQDVSVALLDLMQTTWECNSRLSTLSLSRPSIDCTAE